MNIFPCRFFSNYICLCDVLYPSFIRCDTFFQFHVRLRLKQEKLLHQLGLGFLESWYNLGLVSNIISLVRELFPPKQLHEIKTTFGEGERKIPVIIRPWLGWGQGMFRNHLLHKIMISTLQPNLIIHLSSEINNDNLMFWYYLICEQLLLMLKSLVTRRRKMLPRIFRVLNKRFVENYTNASLAWINTQG